MRYAEVAVNSPAYAQGGRSFSYSIPPEMEMSIGRAVRVPFGSRLLEGVVVELTDTPAFEQTKDIFSLIEEVPPIRQELVALARWISTYYLCPLYDALSLMLPPGFERKSLLFISGTAKLADLDSEVATTGSDYQRVAAILKLRGRVEMRQLEAEIGQRGARAAVSQMSRYGLISKSFVLASARVRAKTETYVSATELLRRNPEEALPGRSKKRHTLLQLVNAEENPVPWLDLKKKSGCTKADLNALVEMGLIGLKEMPVTRDPLGQRPTPASVPPVLTQAQLSALEAIKGSFFVRPNGQPPVFLLHGVTGSGKTEVYLQALDECIRRGKRGIVLVPEISLTPQTIERFASRFGGKVGVLHSHLSLGEQYDEWQRIERNEFDVVIGARSALFCPLSDLGLIVIDEEHEWTYKQQEQSPRYHARDAAIRLAGLVGATVVLGSATPSMESYFRGARGEYVLLSLPDRVTPADNASLPSVDVVDMRRELRSQKGNLFSNRLCEAITKAVDSQEQVILFLNRRGTSTFVQCRKCGFVMRCRRCDISLTYHSVTDTLVCHLCNYRVRAPSVCPRCHDPRIKFLGSGTQKLEEETNRAFAPARVVRWDSDSTRGKGSHEAILRTFVDHRADILVGTQMVAKGLDIPLVTVVGVVNADSGLNLPDFRAAERAFQLLGQVAGRAGRGPRGGEVIMQTYNPEHFAIQAAAKHDYRAFYEKEIAYRRQLGYPPFSNLANLVFTHTNEAACKREAERLKAELETEIARRGVGGLNIIGPAPAFVHRIRGRFRWQMVLRGNGNSEFLVQVPLPKGWTVDIDPVGLA